MGSADRLAAFEGAFEGFNEAFTRVSEGRMGETMEIDTPRRILVEMVMWSRVCRKACEALQRRETPPQFTETESPFPDVANHDVAQLAVPELLAQATDLKNGLAEYLRDLSPGLWSADQGLRHPQGGPATIRRELESLSRRYLDATDELLHWLEAPSRDKR
jgi:hypothetical protein